MDGSIFICYSYYFFLIYFLLCWVFVSMCGLSPVVVSRATLRCSVRASHCNDLPCCRAQTLGTWASVIVVTVQLSHLYMATG